MVILSNMDNNNMKKIQLTHLEGKKAIATVYPPTKA